jgi:hypothetical protein
MVREGEASQPGDMRYASWLLEEPDCRALSDEYNRTWRGKRPPLIVVLPNGTDFIVDVKPSRGGPGWTVTGEAPNITVSPSINCNAFDRLRGYHGFLRDGVFTDDLEGRRYS